MRRVTTSLALAGLLTLAACGGDSGGSDDRAATVDAPPAGTPAKPAEDSGRGDALTEAELKPALLTVQDLPTGYTVGESSEDEDDSEASGASDGCSAKYKALGDADETDVSAEAEASFEGPSLGTVLEHGLESYEDEDVPEQRFKDVLSVLNDCPTFSETDDTGAKTDFTVSALSFPKKGDETVALNIKVKTADFDGVLNFVVVRIGRNVMSIAQGGLTADIAALEQAVNKGVEKLTAASK